MPRPAGRRPVLLLTRNEAYSRRTHVTVAPLTTKIRRMRATVLLTKDDGVKEDSIVNLDDIQTIRKVVLRDRLAELTSQKMSQVEEAIRFALDLPAFR